MYFVTLLIVGIVIGLLNMVFFPGKKFNYGGIWSILIAGILGAWLGDITLGKWGWMLASYNVLAGIVGAVILVIIWDFIALDRATSKH